MTSSGTYNWNPSLGDINLYAFNLAGIRSTELQQEHLTYANIAANKVCLDWSNKGVNLWKVDFVENVPLVAAQTTYDVDPSTIVMLDTYARIVNTGGQTIDRIMTPISRSEYATYPNKQQQGFPTVYWYNRLIDPNVTIWQVPNGSSPQYLCYYRLVQIQDSALASGTTQDMPARWLPAFIDAYAVELARAWAPSRVGDLLQFAKDSYATAANQDTETANWYISPQLSGYFRTK
jgi:hypothetical protein